jgi:hypothetical protein
MSTREVKYNGRNTVKILKFFVPMFVEGVVVAIVLDGPGNNENKINDNVFNNVTQNIDIHHHICIWLQNCILDKTQIHVADCKLCNQSWA